MDDDTSVYFRRIISIICLLALAGLSPAWEGSALAKPRNWRQEITYEQFESLLRRKVAQLYELQLLWFSSQTTLQPTQAVYFAGGRLRTLIGWLDRELSKNTYEEVQRMRPPAVRRLSSILATDQDLIVIQIDAKDPWLTYHLRPLSAQGWDVLSEDFARDSVAAGGSAIEKVGVRPEDVRDPLGGLRAYYEGYHKYVDVPEAQFATFRGDANTSGLHGNSKVALVLRFLRFAHDMPGAKVRDEDWQRLRGVSEAEVARGAIPRGNYWIEKSLGKLYQSAGPLGLRSDTQRIGLATPLQRSGYSLLLPRFCVKQVKSALRNSTQFPRALWQALPFPAKVIVSVGTLGVIKDRLPKLQPGPSPTPSAP